MLPFQQLPILILLRIKATFHQPKQAKNSVRKKPFTASLLKVASNSTQGDQPQAADISGESPVKSRVK